MRNVNIITCHTVRNNLRDTFTFKQWHMDQSATVENEAIINTLIIEMWKCRIGCYVRYMIK